MIRIGNTILNEKFIKKIYLEKGYKEIKISDNYDSLENIIYFEVADSETVELPITVTIKHCDISNIKSIARNLLSDKLSEFSNEIFEYISDKINFKNDAEFPGKFSKKYKVVIENGDFELREKN